jgi:hypothetical protein
MANGNDRAPGGAGTTTPPDRVGWIAWLLLYAGALLLFYLLDHSLMSLQGLPLSPDLTPRR